MLVLESKSGMKLVRVVIAPKHTQLEEIRVGLPKPISPKAHQNTCHWLGISITLFIMQLCAL